MKNSLICACLAAILLFSPVSSFSRVLHKDYGKKPSSAPQWISQSIVSDGDYIYATGKSDLLETQEKAKESALSDATQNFVRYCKVDVESFDRSIETYSKKNGKQTSSNDSESNRQVRSKAFVTRAVPSDWYVTKKGSKYTAYVLLKVPKEEFDRISSEKNITISMDVLFYYENRYGKMQVLAENSVLSSGDGFSIYVNPSDSCYLYVFQIDSPGKTFKLFPSKEFNTAENPLSPAQELWLPNDKQLYTLDETTGKEYTYLFASPDPIKEFENIKPDALTKSNLDDIIKIKKMGVAGLKDKRDSKKITVKHTSDITEVKRKLQAEGVFVYESWFWHK